MDVADVHVLAELRLRQRKSRRAKRTIEFTLTKYGVLLSLLIGWSSF